ncbi:MAG: response regulator [Nitrospirota bacterium]
MIYDIICAMDGKDRRKHKRVPFHEDVIIDGILKFKGIDISEGGLYVYTGRSFAEGRIVDATFSLRDEKMTVKARVQHNQAGVGMGLQFHDPTDEQKALIKEVVEATAGKTSQTGARKKILLIEDNDMSRQISKSKLVQEGFTVIEARDGLQGLNLLKEKSPDLVILDLYMEKMDGFKVLSILKMTPEWQDLPVIVFSARGTPDVVDKVISAGATEFLLKMVTTPAKLAQAVKTVLHVS